MALLKFLIMKTSKEKTSIAASLLHFHALVHVHLTSTLWGKCHFIPSTWQTKALGICAIFLSHKVTNGKIRTGAGIFNNTICTFHWNGMLVFSSPRLFINIFFTFIFPFASISFFYFIFLKFYFIFKLYITVLVLPNIKMNPPQVYMCSDFFIYLLEI